MDVIRVFYHYLPDRLRPPSQTGASWGRNLALLSYQYLTELRDGHGGDERLAARSSLVLSKMTGAGTDDEHPDGSSKKIDAEVGPEAHGPHRWVAGAARPIEMQPGRLFKPHASGVVD